MAVEKVNVYKVECDGCCEVLDYYDTKSQALERLKNSAWQYVNRPVVGKLLYCPSCQDDCV